MEKICSKCKKPLSLDSFSKDKYKANGLCSTCKMCRHKYRCEHKEEISKQGSEYYLKNKDKIIKYRIENKDRIAKHSSEYQHKHKKRISEYQSKYRASHKDEKIKYAAKYFQANKGMFGASGRKHKAMKLNQMPDNANMKEILFYYSVCSETNKILGDIFYHVDHIHPLSKGGPHHEDNLQILEADLNSGKKAKWPLSEEEQIKYRGVTLC